MIVRARATMNVHGNHREKGRPSFSILKRTPRSQADLPASGVTGMSWFEGFQLLS